MTDNTGASPRLTVQESGQVPRPGLPAAPVQAQALCFGAGGVLGGCALTPGGTGFIDNRDGTVTDNTTGLMWEKKTGTVGASVVCTPPTCADPHDVNNRYTWSASGACIDETVFGPTVPDVYWSSSTRADIPIAARIVDFSSGLSGNSFSKAFDFYVRAVRGGL